MAHFRVNTNDFKAGIRKLLEKNKALAKAAMGQVAAEVQKGAMMRAPVDAGNLVNSISSQVVEYKKSFAAVVFVPVNAPVTVHTDADNEVSPSNYAIAMHENEYELGAKSLAKQEDVKCVVGRRYLARAVEEQKPRLLAVVGEALKL